MPERQMSPEKIREFRLNDFVKGIIRGATGLKEKSDDSGTNTVSVAEFNATQEMLRNSIEKALSEGFALREIIEKLKPALDSGEYKLEPHEDQLNLTALLRSCATVAESGEGEEQKEKINEVIIKDIEAAKTVAEPVRVNFSMVPPDDLPGPQVDREKSIGTGIEKRTLPRTEELISLLQNFDQMEEGDRYYRIQYDAKLAGNDPRVAERMRKKEYEMFVIPELQVMILVCDEEGNSTFVIRRPCLSQEDLQQKMAGKKVDSSAGDDPRFYAGLKKSQLYNLVNEEDRSASVVVEVEWNSEEWADDMLDAITAPMSNAGGEISFGEITEIAGRVEENKRLVYEFLGKMDPKELRYIDTDKCYHDFLEEYGLTKEKCVKRSFSPVFFHFLESAIDFSPVKMAKEFLAQLSDEELRSRGVDLYERFLKVQDIKRETWSRNAFRIVLAGECDKRGIVREFKVNEILRDQIKKYLDEWTVEELLNVSYSSLYDKLIEGGVINAEQVRRSQMPHLLEQVRQSRGIKKREVVSSDIRKKIDDFFDLERIPGSADPLEVDLRKPSPVLYQKFLEHTGLTEDQYAYRAFNARLNRERKGWGIELHDNAADLMRAYFEARDASEPDSVANSDLEQIYQDFLQKNDLEATADLRIRFLKNRLGYLDKIGKRSKESQKKALVDSFFLGLSLTQLGIGERMNRERTRALYEQCLEKTGLASEEYSFDAFQVKLVRERNAKQERGGAPDRKADLMRAYFEARDASEPDSVVNSDLEQLYDGFLQERGLESSENLLRQFRRNRLSHLARKGQRVKEPRTKPLTDSFFSGLSSSQLGIGQSMNIERTRVLYKQCLEETGLTPEEYSFSGFSNKLIRARIARAGGKNSGND